MSQQFGGIVFNVLAGGALGLLYWFFRGKKSQENVVRTLLIWIGLSIGLSVLGAIFHNAWNVIWAMVMVG